MSDENEKKDELPPVPSAISGDRAKQDALRTMMRSEGWTILRDYCLDQEKARIAAIMSQPVGNQEQVYAQEYSKAEAWTYHTLAGLPQMLIDTMQDNITHEISKLREAGEKVDHLEEDGDGEEGTVAADVNFNCP